MSLVLLSLVIIYTPSNFVGGKTGLQLSTWKSLASDSRILGQIEGVHPEFVKFIFASLSVTTSKLY